MKLLKQGMKVHMFHKYIAKVKYITEETINKTQYDVNKTNNVIHKNRNHIMNIMKKLSNRYVCLLNFFLFCLRFIFSTTFKTNRFLPQLK